MLPRFIEAEYRVTLARKCERFARQFETCNWIKTWYAPLLFRPQLFLRGVRLLFGDHAMFFRRADFLALAVDGGSTDASVAIAEAARLLVVRHETRGRAAAINRGVQEATAPIICVLHG